MRKSFVGIREMEGNALLYFFIFSDNFFQKNLLIKSYLFKTNHIMFKVVCVRESFLILRFSETGPLTKFGRFRFHFT